MGLVYHEFSWYKRPMWSQKHRQLAIRADDPGVAEPFRICAQGLGEDGEEVAVDISPSIARIEISGPLVDETSLFGRFFGGETPYADIRAALAAADASPAETTLVTMRSPGGEFIGMGETAAAFRATSNRLAAWAPKAFSAAYALASGANVIAMPTDGRIGSLSVFGVSIDESAAAEKAGVKVRIHSPDETKGAGFPGAPVPDAALKEMDALAAKGKAQFADIIRAGRPDIEGLPVLMKAQTFTAAEALQAGLIDEVHDTEAEFLASLFNQDTEAPMADEKKKQDAGGEPDSAKKEEGGGRAKGLGLEAALAKAIDGIGTLTATVAAQNETVKTLSAKVDALATHAEASGDQKLRARIVAADAPNADLEMEVCKALVPELREKHLAQLEATGKARIDFAQLAELATTYDGQDEEGNLVKIRRDGGLAGADPNDVNQEDARLHAMASAAGAKVGAEGSVKFQAAYEAFCQEHERREVSA